MKRKILLTLLLSTSAVLVCIFGYEVLSMFVLDRFASAPLPPPPTISLSAGGVEVVIDESTTWHSIAKLIATVLGTYLGVKVINKYV